MSADEFLEFRDGLMREYAIELADATGVTAEEAEAMADAHLKESVAEDSPANVPLRIFDPESDAEVGALWLVADGEDSFLMDFRIEEEFRGRGFGRAAMEGVEQLARASGAKQIRLHVFARNRVARTLYERQGYEVVSLQMRKLLP
jgi:ribosomal protein S18 acetylase RimI-like enzyme